MTCIKIFRESESSLWSLKYKIMINGKNSGKIRNGQTIEIPVKPGRYEIYVKINWWRSNKITFSAAEGEQVQFRCSYRKRTNRFNVFHEVYYTYYKFSEYLLLEKVDDLKEV